MESKLWLWELGQTPCSHPLYHREPHPSSRSLAALAVPCGTHGSGCCSHHAQFHVLVCHAVTGQLQSWGSVPLWHSPCCRHSFPEMHVKPGAPVTFRNVPLPRIKQNKYYLVPYLFSCLLMHTCLQPCPRLRPSNSSQLLESISVLQGHFSQEPFL